MAFYSIQLGSICYKLYSSDDAEKNLDRKRIKQLRISIAL